MPPITKVPRSDEFHKVRNRELELRRLSGEISCSECRRMKLKCDKKIPCCHCVRRGCQQLCPIGRPISDSTRTKLTDASSQTQNAELKRKLEEMSERIRILEDALHVESFNRTSPHPLLKEDLLSIKNRKWVDTDVREHNRPEEEVVRAFGTMSITEGRNIRYIGASATENQLLLGVLGNQSETSEEASSDELVRTSDLWPFLSCNKETLLAQLVSQLPSYARTTGLVEAYLFNLSWFTSTIHREQILDELVPMFYPNRRPLSSFLISKTHVHELALLFAVLACGAVADLTLPPINAEGEHFLKLSRAALGMQDILKDATLAGVQAIFLIGSYGIFCGRKTSMEESWKMYAIGSSIAASIGLHRDPSKWNFDPKMTDRRRRVFWEIYMLDQWKSIQTGRPPCFTPDVVDCELPMDKMATIKEDGTIKEGAVRQWRFRFARDILPLVSKAFCSVHPIRYKDILELDRKIRDFDDYPDTYYQAECKIECSELYATFRILYPYITVLEKEEILVQVNRNYFAHAILNFPDDPTKSPYAASFLATFRSSCKVLDICYEHYDKIALVMSRIWPLWGLMLVSAVVVGSVASLGSSIGYATTAFKELENAISLFQRSEHTVAKHALPILYKLRERAIKALSRPPLWKSSHQYSAVNCSRGTGAFQLSQGQLPNFRDVEEDKGEELLILSGVTRVLEHRDTKSDSLAVSRILHHAVTYSASPSPSISGSSLSESDTGSKEMPTNPPSNSNPESTHTHQQSAIYQGTPDDFLGLLNKQTFSNLNTQTNADSLLGLYGQAPSHKIPATGNLGGHYFENPSTAHWDQELANTASSSMNLSTIYNQTPNENVRETSSNNSSSCPSVIFHTTPPSVMNETIDNEFFGMNGSAPLQSTYQGENVDVGNQTRLDLSNNVNDVSGSGLLSDMADVDPRLWSRFMEVSGFDFSNTVGQGEDEDARSWMNWAT